MGIISRMMQPCHLRERGFPTGELSTGPLNSLTDVPGVRVGHATLVSGEGALQPGLGPVRTGVTVILPHGGNLFLEKVPAAVHTINGYGKPAGFEQTRELGLVEAPIALTNTLNVGLVLDALVQYSCRQNPEIGVAPGSGSVNVIVAETNDGYLNDIQGRHVRAEHVWAAIEGASAGPVQEGAVGAGTGTVCFGWKGGIGSASRKLTADLGDFTLLVQTNFGRSKDMIVHGTPVGRFMQSPASQPVGMPGSVVVVLATDAPLDVRQLGRLCVRAAAGLALTGARFSHGSGDFVIAFSTAYHIHHRIETLIDSRAFIANEAAVINPLFQAVSEAVEESVLNSHTCKSTVNGRDGHVAQALPLEPLIELLNDQKDRRLHG
jgi:D-aminopeptidase